MSAPKENQFWKLRSKHGRDKLFNTPALLWDAACEYFEWCDENPLMESKAFHAQGLIVTTELPKLRAYTLDGFLLYIRAGDSYLRNFRYKAKEKKDQKSKGFMTVIREIEKTIYNQKFTGASADLLNANIIARDLGLTDKQAIEHTDNLIKVTIDGRG